MSHPPLPPFTIENAISKVRMAEDAWNTRDPWRVLLDYTPDSLWRNRAECLQGRKAIEAFLTRESIRSVENLDRQIRYFVKIAELKSLSKAADNLDLTQSGLSRQLASLESYLGKLLFSRTGRGVELTDAGRLLLTSAKPSYALIDTALETIREKEGVTQGNVRLATVHTLSYYFTADVLSTFVGCRPHVNLSVSGRSSPEVVDLVENGKADIGFVYDAAVASANLTTIPLFEDEMCLIIGEDSSVGDAVDLTVAPPRLVGFPHNYLLRRMLEASQPKLEFAAEADTIDAMLRLVASGVGACVLPSRMPDSIIKDYRLKKIRLARPRIKRRVVAIVRNDRHPSGLIKQLLETAVAKAIALANFISVIPPGS